tara:strand:+ start:3756 stop:5801 length:2046 start_codon:yes stop_codon:yes gene_type:complete
MTFLYPTALIFLMGIGIPILIHILNRFNVKKVNYSSVRFLKSMENNSIRSLKFKKWILLLLRIGILSALVFMLSRPVTKGFIPGWLSTEIDSRLLIVIDNSSSMSGYDDGKSLLEIAKNTAKKLSEIYEDNTTISIAQTCPPKVLYAGKSSDENNSIIIDQIKQTKDYDNIWFIVDSLTTTLNIAEPVRECIILSDFQTKSDFVDSLSMDWKYYLINVGEAKNNLSINQLDIVSRIKVSDQLLKIKTTIHNSNQTPTNNIPINLLFDENRVGQVISDFEAKTNKDFIFQAYPNRKGMLTGSITLPKDDYLNDNVWYLSTPILNKIKCLIISNSEQDYNIFDLIINAIDPNKQLINLELRKQPILNRLFVDDIDILVVHNPEAITEAAFNELDIFLKNGGGLIWFSGGIESDPIYQKYFSNLRFPVATRKIELTNGSYSVLMPSNDDHILSDLNVRKLSNELPKVFNYVKHIPKVKQKVHLELNNGDPFLIDFDRGSGKIFYFTSLLNLNWNDLTLRGLLIPLMYRLLILGGTDEVNSLPVIIGESKWIILNGNELRNQWEVKSPSGIKNLIVPDFSKESLKITQTYELGVYSIFKNKDLYTSFATELHPNEIVSKQLSVNEIDLILNGLEYKFIKASQDFISVFKEIRHGKALWKIFLILAIILFLLETWIARPSLNNSRK